MASPLTLEAFGVDRDALARRIAERQQEIGRDDVACAKIAEVTLERWQAWKRPADAELPGVARVPKIAAALDVPASWVLYGDTIADDLSTVGRASTADARQVADILQRLTPAVETVAQLAEEIARLNLPIPGGARMGVSLGVSGEQLSACDAVTLSAGAGK